MCVLLSNLYLEKIYTLTRLMLHVVIEHLKHKGNCSRCEIYVVKHKKSNARLFYLSFQ